MSALVIVLSAILYADDRIVGQLGGADGVVGQIGSRQRIVGDISA